MREFSKVSPVLWSSTRFTGLPSDDARYLYLYLLTCEHQNSAGVFKLNPAYALADLRWEASRYSTALAQLVESDLVHHDEVAQVVLITRWFKHNPPMGESHLKGVLKMIQKLPSSPLAAQAQAEVQQVWDGIQLAKATSRSVAGVSDISRELRTKASKWIG